MKWIIRLLLLLTLVAVAVWGIWFASKNTQVVALDLVFLQLPEASISVWVAGAFALGGIIGVALSVIMITRLKAHEMRLNRKIQNYQRELDATKSKAVVTT